MAWLVRVICGKDSWLTIRTKKKAKKYHLRNKSEIRSAGRKVENISFHPLGQRSAQLNQDCVLKCKTDFDDGLLFLLQVHACLFVCSFVESFCHDLNHTVIRSKKSWPGPGNIVWFGYSRSLKKEPTISIEDMEQWMNINYCYNYFQHRFIRSLSFSRNM